MIGHTGNEYHESAAQLRFFHDSNVRFPKYPTFAAGLSIRTVPRGLGIDFLGGPRRFVLRGREVWRLYTFLRDSLDGERTIDDLLGILPPEIRPPSLLATLKLLHEQGVLVEGGDLAQVESDVADQQRTRSTFVGGVLEGFWQRKIPITRSAENAGEIVDRIASARILLLTSGLVGQLTEELLGRTGFSNVQAIPLDNSVESSSVNPSTQCDPSEDDSIDAFLTAMQSPIDHVDLTIACLHGQAPRLSLSLNELCLDMRTPLLFASENGEQANVMLVDPYRSACLLCRELRQNLVSQFALEDYLFAASEIHVGTWRPHGPAGESIVAATLIAGHVAGEAVRHVGRISPAVFVNANLSLDLVSGLSSVESVLRVPRCPMCSRAPLEDTYKGRK